MGPLRRALNDSDVRSHVAADAIAEAERAVRERTGVRGITAQLGLDTINRLRPGFLERHIHEMLPDMATAVESHWADGQEAGDPAEHLVTHADAVTAELLGVTDAYVDNAQDAKAIAVYRQLRGRAPARIAEQMPRIAEFLDRHTPT